MLYKASKQLLLDTKMKMTWTCSKTDEVACKSSENYFPLVAQVRIWAYVNKMLRFEDKKMFCCEDQDMICFSSRVLTVFCVTLVSVYSCSFLTRFVSNSVFSHKLSSNFGVCQFLGFFGKNEKWGVNCTEVHPAPYFYILFYFVYLRYINIHLRSV